MKRYLLRFAPWAALMVLGVTGTARLANTTPPPERHPRIHAAVRALREARAELQAAAHDFCGHRAEAVERTDAALRQLELAAE
jgi:hypothetical protein